MLRYCNRFVLLIICGLVILSAPSICRAHFLWVKTVTQDEKPQAFLFFGETPDEEAYHLPEPLAKTKIWSRGKDGKRAELAVKGIETDDRIGLIAPLEGEGPRVIETTQTYGIYGKSLLTYYAKHVHGASAEEINSAG